MKLASAINTKAARESSWQALAMHWYWGQNVKRSVTVRVRG